MVPDRQQHLGDAQPVGIRIERDAHAGVAAASQRLSCDVRDHHRHDADRHRGRSDRRSPRAEPHRHDDADRSDDDRAEHGVVGTGRADERHQRDRGGPAPPAWPGPTQATARPQRQVDRDRHRDVVGQEQVPHRGTGELRGRHGEHDRGDTAGQRRAVQPTHHDVGRQPDHHDRQQQIDVGGADRVAGHRPQAPQHDQVRTVRPTRHVHPVHRERSAEAVVRGGGAGPTDGLQQRQVCHRVTGVHERRRPRTVPDPVHDGCHGPQHGRHDRQFDTPAGVCSDVAVPLHRRRAGTAVGVHRLVRGHDRRVGDGLHQFRLSTGPTGPTRPPWPGGPTGPPRRRVAAVRLSALSAPGGAGPR